MNNGRFSGSLPYPTVKSVKPDRRFARMLQPSRISELNAISDYIYNSIIFEEIYPWLSTLFEEISMTEMIHYELLSELVKALGINPAINAGIRNTPINISPDTASVAPRAARRTLQSAAKCERASASEYAKLAEQTNDPAVCSILRRLSSDETAHARLLENACEKVQLA